MLELEVHIILLKWFGKIIKKWDVELDKKMKDIRLLLAFIIQEEILKNNIKNVFIGNNTIDNNVYELSNYPDYDAYINNEMDFYLNKFNIILFMFILFIEFIWILINRNFVIY